MGPDAGVDFRGIYISVHVFSFGFRILVAIRYLERSDHVWCERGRELNEEGVRYGGNIESKYIEVEFKMIPGSLQFQHRPKTV